MLTIDPRGRPDGPSRPVLALLAGVVAGLVGVLAFAVVHGTLIVPIWSRLLHGIPFAVVGGVAAGWAFEELRRAGRLVFPPIRAGLAYGVLLWIAVVPATALGAAFRLTGVHGAIDPWEDVAAMGVVLASGAVAGWLLTGRLRATAALALATLTLMAAMAGPVPVTNSPRAGALFAAFLPLCATCGVVLAVVRARLARSTAP